MVFNEWVKDGSLFTEINTITPSTFITKYGAANLDLIYKMRYGAKTIPSSMESLTVPDVARIISISYGDNWNNKYKLLHDEILLGVESRVIVEASAKDDIIRSSDSNSESNVSAFNEDTMTPNDSDSNTVNDDTNKTSTKNSSTTHTNMNAIRQQLELFNSSFINTICEDVRNIVSLPIY